VQGCGISWNKPSFHFDSVNEWGYVSYWEEIGTVDMGGREIPLFINFLSNKRTSSPYLGYGWTLALLESRVEQVDENKFRIWQPNGKYRTFRRDKENPNLLKGSGGWLGEITGDRIIAKADCGWGLSFKNGKISSMSTPDGKTYGYRYESGKVKSIRETQSGNEVVEVVEDPLEPGLLKLKMGDETIVMEQGEKPRIEQINGQNLIGGMDQSLVAVHGADGKTRNISYDMEASNIVPTFKPTAERTFTTHPGTGLIVTDGAWRYQIKQDQQHPWNNAAITRTNAQKQNEFWHKNNVKGQEIIRSASGLEKVRSWYLSGNLAGKKRKSVTKINGNIEDEIKYSYNEDGLLLRREWKKKGTYQYTYDQMGRLQQVSLNQETILKKFYDEKGNLASHILHGTEKIKPN